MKNENKKTRLFLDMDGVLAKWTHVNAYEELLEKGFFQNLEPQLWVLAGLSYTLQSFKDCNIEVYIISACVNSEYSRKEKALWLERYFPVEKERIIFVPDGDDKADHVPEGIKEGDVLIDDYTLNLKRWQDAGGTAVKLYNGVNGKQTIWDRYIPNEADVEKFRAHLGRYLNVT